MMWQSPRLHCAQARHTQIYAHKSCHAGLAIPGGEILPWFSTEWSAAGGRTKTSVRYALEQASRLSCGYRWPSLAGWVWSLAKRQSGKPTDSETATISAAAENFGKEATAALRHAGCSEDDIIFLPTIRTSELFALWKAVQRAPELQSVQFHIVLRRDAAEMDLPEDGAPGISFLFRELHAASAGKGFHFYCDTQQLCNDYALLSCHRLEFGLLPIPFPRADPDPLSLEKWSAGPAIKLVYLGGARMEKGFHLLSCAENFSAEKYARGIFSGVFQAPVSGDLEEPEVIAARRHLSSAAGWQRRSGGAQSDLSEFQSLSAFSRYRPAALHSRILSGPQFRNSGSGSGGGKTRRCAGRILAVQPDKWAGRGGIHGASGFPDAVLQAVEQLPQLSKEAQDRAATYAALHNADVLLGMLEKDAL